MLCTEQCDINEGENDTNEWVPGMYLKLIFTTALYSTETV